MKFSKGRVNLMATAILVTWIIVAYLNMKKVHELEKQLEEQCNHEIST